MSYESPVGASISQSASRDLQGKALWTLPALLVVYALWAWGRAPSMALWVQGLAALTLVGLVLWSRRVPAQAFGRCLEVGLAVWWLSQSLVLVIAPSINPIGVGVLTVLPVAAATCGVSAAWRWAGMAAATAAGFGLAAVVVGAQTELGRNVFQWPAVFLLAGVSLLAIWIAKGWEQEQKHQEELRGRLRDYQRQEMINDRQRRELVTNMSHELRTPLAGILGLSELLADDASKAERLRHLQLLQESTRGLLAIVDDLLDVGRIESGSLRLILSPTDLGGLTERVVGLLAPRAVAKGLKLDCRVDPSLPSALEADPVRVRQILLNLLANAIKFTEKGTVEVEVQWLAANSRVRFEVRDTGIGIAESAIPRLFSPFQQADSSTSRRFGGTGLGLSISKSLVDLMGGWIGVESRRGVGSTFWFELPLSSAEEPSAAEVISDEADLRLAGRRILVVEDDPINRLVVVSKLEVFGVEVVIAESGSEALEQLHTETFDLVLMDCQIPGIDGYETTRRLRQSDGPQAAIPVVALTAHSHPDERGRCLAAGMNDYLVKPVSSEQLFRTLKVWLEPSESSGQVASTQEVEG